MFRKIFRLPPKWRHEDPETRRRAIQQLGPERREELLEIVRQESQPELRRLALRNLYDVETLVAVMAEDADAGVREIARSRLRKLLAGEVEGDEGRHLPPVTRRVDLVQRIDDMDLLGHLAQRAGEPEIRGAAIARVVDDPALAEVAIHDRIVAHRLAAVERIEGREALERVLRETRKKDKQVSRRAKEKLELLVAAEQRPAQLRADAERICERIERLGRGQQWEQDDATLVWLAEQWERLVAESGELLEESLRQRFTDAREGYLALAADHHRNLQAQREATAALEAGRAVRSGLLDALDTLRGEVLAAAGSLNEETIAPLGERLIALRKEWDGLDPLPGGRDPQRGRFEQGFDELSERLALQVERRGVAGDLEGWLNELAQGIDQPPAQPLPERELRGLLRRIEEGIQELGEAGQHSLQRRFDELRQQLEQRLEQQRARRKERLQGLDGWLEELERELDAGHSKEAGALAERVQSAFQYIEASGGGREAERLLQRFHRLQPQLRELQDWRSWSANLERERLCREMEEIPALNLHPTTLAEQIHALQQEWKKLDAGRAGAPRSLWGRFSAAADCAYEPVKRFREEQAAQREQHRLEREGWLAEQEAWLDAVEWEGVDWKLPVTRERELRRDWRQFGEVERKAWRGLQRRFDALLDRFEERLRPERERCLRQRRGLIAQIEALAGAEDLRRAIDETKRLQGEWQVTVPLDRREENELWGALRAASDAVFQRSHEEREARQRDEQQGLEQRQAICAAIEALTGCDAAGLEAARQQLQQLRGEWHDAGQVPRRDLAAVDRRYRDALKGFDRHAERLREQLHRAGMERLRDKAALCLDLERLVVQGGDSGGVLVEILARWEAIAPADDGAAERLIQQRFATAREALDGDPDAATRIVDARESQRALRERLALHMEILAEVDSPADAQEPRMAFQVERLATAMHTGKQEPTQEAGRVERDWYLTGFAGTEVEAVLQSRFARALAAFHSAH